MSDIAKQPVVKTGKSNFDLQVASVEASILHKEHKGITFAQLSGNNLTYVNIPSVPAQRFIYLENTSKLTREQREALRKNSTIKFPKTVEFEDEP